MAVCPEKTDLDFGGAGGRGDGDFGFRIADFGLSGYAGKSFFVVKGRNLRKSADCRAALAMTGSADDFCVLPCGRENTLKLRLGVAPAMRGP